MKRKRIISSVLGILFSLSIVTCKKQEDTKIKLSEEYKLDFKEAISYAYSLNSLVQGQVTPDKYFSVLPLRLPKILKFINKYEGSEPESEQKSYLFLKEVPEAYLTANKLWRARKGMVLVTGRWKLAFDMTDKATAAFAEETK